MFVSVLAVRGRVGDVHARRRWSDLGHTARIQSSAIADIKVGWREHELKVKVTPEKTVYRVRDQAKVSIQVERGDGKPLPIGTRDRARGCR